MIYVLFLIFMIVVIIVGSALHVMEEYNECSRGDKRANECRDHDITGKLT